MAGSKRNYRREYDLYHSKPKQKKRRAQRNAAKAKNKKCKGDVHHKDGNTKNNAKSNLVCKSKSSNRSFSRKKDKSHARKKK